MKHKHALEELVRLRDAEVATLEHFQTRAALLGSELAKLNEHTRAAKERLTSLSDACTTLQRDTGS